MKLHPMTMMCVGPPVMTLDLKLDLFGMLHVAWRFSHRVDYL